jgi:[ribosomal protein S18]-alanine N-acetyltransferase
VSGEGRGVPLHATPRDATLADLQVAASWIRSEEECLLWAGPEVSFPLGLERLAAQIGMDDAASLALTDDGEVVAFGQLVRPAPGTAHLARLIVRPDARGRGLGHVLVRALLERAAADGAGRATLNVYARNAAAVRLYEAAGFRRAVAEDAQEGDAPVWHMTLDLAPPQA